MTNHETNWQDFNHDEQNIILKQAGIDYKAGLLCSQDSHQEQASLNMNMIWRLANGLAPLTSQIKGALLQNPRWNRQFRSFRDAATCLSFDKRAAADSMHYDGSNLNHIDLPNRFSDANSNGDGVIEIKSSSVHEELLILTLTLPLALQAQEKPAKLIEICNEDASHWVERPLDTAYDGKIDLRLHKKIDKEFIAAYVDLSTRIYII